MLVGRLFVYCSKTQEADANEGHGRRLLYSTSLSLCLQSVPVLYCSKTQGGAGRERGLYLVLTGVLQHIYEYLIWHGTTVQRVQLYIPQNNGPLLYQVPPFLNLIRGTLQTPGG